jgi:hypothetical protein
MKNEVAMAKCRGRRRCPGLRLAGRRTVEVAVPVRAPGRQKGPNGARRICSATPTHPCHHP